MKKVLLIGAGADSIEHGDELDAAAFQVASVLKEQGWETILIDDNPFSFTLDCPDAIDHACIKSLTVENIVATIKQYHPDAILPTLGGRRAFELIQAVSRPMTLSFWEYLKLRFVRSTTQCCSARRCIISTCLPRPSLKSIITLMHWRWSNGSAIRL